MRSTTLGILVTLVAFPLIGCASSSGSGKKAPPSGFSDLLLRDDLVVSILDWPDAICAPGWKRDPDMDSGFINDWDEDDYIGKPKAAVQYVSYSPRSADDSSVPARGDDVRVGAWRHRRWWVEPEWAELRVIRTNVAFGRAPGAKTWTRLSLTPRGVTDREETSIVRFETAPWGDKPNPYRDRWYAVLEEGSPAAIGLLDDDVRVVARFDDADPDKVDRLGFGGYLVRTADAGEWLNHVVDDRGVELVEPFRGLQWYAPPPVRDQADSSVAYPKKFLMPVDVPANLARRLMEKYDAELSWPIALESEFVPRPELCVGAAYLGSRTWAVFWESPDGPRIAFSDSGNPDVADMAASQSRARWADFEVKWTQFAPNTKSRWVLTVAEQKEDRSLEWYAFADAECERPTEIGPEAHGSKESLDIALADIERRVKEDERRIAAMREAERKRIAEAIASGNVKVEPAIPASPSSRSSAPATRFEECVRCEGKGYLVSMRSYTTRYTPSVTYRNGLRITERSSITSSRPHYDGVCGACNGNGGFQVR